MRAHTWQKRRHFTSSSYMWVVFNQGSIPKRHSGLYIHINGGMSVEPQILTMPCSLGCTRHDEGNAARNPSKTKIILMYQASLKRTSRSLPPFIDNT